MDIRTFEKLKIDLSPLGFNQKGESEFYYCTPKGAKIIASSGVDGIHFCTVPQFGDVIFAVSPMNFGDCVHPIARCFEDLLCLLLHCKDVAALEQCYAWDKEQYNAFLTDFPATKEQQAVLDEIRDKCCLEPFEDSYEYVKELQAEFDLSQITYTEEYYDPDMNPYAPETENEWSVYYDFGYWNKNAKGERCEEIAVNKSFVWGDEKWHIPAVYICAEGLVIDFCVEIDPEKEKAYLDKWYPVLSSGESIGSRLRCQIEQENPLDINFRFRLLLNGERINAEHGTSVCWIPESCLPDGVRSERELKEIIRHYILDENRAWSFHRWSCPWSGQENRKIESLEIGFEREYTAIDGIHFSNPSVGDVIEFVHPVHKTEHKLTVLSYEKREFSGRGFKNEEYEFPTLHTAMTYTLEPDIPSVNFQLRDTKDNEQPKLKPKKPYAPEMSYDACTVAVIGGADGPTAFFVSPAGDSIQEHMTMSALRFEYAEDIEWKVIFREKLMDDVEISLL